MWIIDKAMDRISCLTHLIGVIFSFLMLFVMIIMAKICKSDLVSLYLECRQLLYIVLVVCIIIIVEIITIK